MLSHHLRAKNKGKGSDLKGLGAYFQVTLRAKIAMPDLQRYPLMRCLIKYKLDIKVYNVEN